MRPGRRKVARKTVVPRLYRTGGRAGDAIQLLVVLVLLPAVALLAVAILMLVLHSPGVRLFFAAVTGVLVACLGVGTVLAALALRRQERLASLQNEFVSRAGHELRTPLTAISMCAETLLLGRERSEGERRQLVETLAAETARLRERIDRLLQWGRIESGRQRYEREPLDLRKVVAEAVRVSRPTFAARGQPLSVVAADGPVRVAGDREALVDSVINLLANASRYSPEGAPVEVGVRREGSRARLWVEDRGIGIPGRELGKIFQRFHRGATPSGNRDEGAGLGLAIVRDVVGGHGGRIEVESVPGEGSTFTLVLPLLEEEPR